MKDLKDLKSENIKEIIIYNIYWRRYRENWNNKKKIKVDINYLNNFKIENCNSHEYMYFYLKKYLTENFSDENDYFVDYFSYCIYDKNGECFVSKETILIDDKTLNFNTNKI